MDVDRPTDSAFNQQRTKLLPEAVEAVFHKFNESVDSLTPQAGYRFLAADGSTATFFSKPKFSPAEYFVEPGHSAKGFYSVHINAFYDLERHTYTDASTARPAFPLPHERHPFQRAVSGFDFPEEEAFDMDVDVTLVRSHSSKIIIEGGYRRFVDKAASFDFIEYGSKDAYRMAFRIVRFPICDGTYECAATNLPRDEFPPERIKRLYFPSEALKHPSAS